MLILKIFKKAADKLPKIILVFFQPTLSFNFYMPCFMFFKELAIFTRSSILLNVYCSKEATYFYHFYPSSHYQLIFVLAR